MWFVYIVQCGDGSLYTGITTNLERRLEEHNSSLLGAKYVRGRRPARLVHSRQVADRGAASREEFRIKQLSRAEKLKLVEESTKGTGAN